MEEGMVLQNGRGMPLISTGIVATRPTTTRHRQLRQLTVGEKGPHLSTSCRNVLSRFVFFAFAALAAANTCHADSDGRMDVLTSLVLSKVRSNDDFPSGYPARVDIRKDAIRTISRGDTIFPVRISFEGVTNSYCRLVVVDSTGSSAQLTPVPLSLDSDQCKYVRLIAFTDLNNDLADDIFLAIRLPSNRHDADVEELRVYLSRNGSATQFCLAENLANLPTNGKVVDTVKAEVRRLGNSVLECAD